MGKEERIKLIKELEKIRTSHVICYLTSDRPFHSAQIAEDIIRIFFEHLEKIGKNKKLDLFIYSRGGDIHASWRLVNLIREYCEEFNVLIPYRAHSSATLISLGANNIVMTELGELGPVDPTVSNEFNPNLDENNPGQKIGISVEDVNSYFSLAKNRIGLTEQDKLAYVFDRLVENIHPLALGNVERSHNQIRMLAKKLLDIHMVKAEDEYRKKEIIEYLTEKLFSHKHYISRREAKDEIKLNVVYTNVKEKTVLLKLYNEYEKEMKLNEPVKEPVLMFADITDNEISETHKLAFIESTNRSDEFVQTMKFIRVFNPQDRSQFKIEVIPIESCWKLIGIAESGSSIEVKCEN